MAKYDEHDIYGDCDGHSNEKLPAEYSLCVHCWGINS